VQLLKKMAARSVAGARMFTIYLARDLGVPQSRIEQVVTDWGKRDWVEFSGEWQELVVADSLWVRAKIAALQGSAPTATRRVPTACGRVRVAGE
jgi:hypothetical protein